jgi:hypothetical protein
MTYLTGGIRAFTSGAQQAYNTYSQYSNSGAQKSAPEPKGQTMGRMWNAKYGKIK